MNDEVKKLKEERDYYKEQYETMMRIHETQHETIKAYHKIVMLQDEELKKREGEDDD